MLHFLHILGPGTPKLCIFSSLCAILGLPTSHFFPSILGLFDPAVTTPALFPPPYLGSFPPPHLPMWGHFPLPIGIISPPPPIGVISPPHSLHLGSFPPRWSHSPPISPCGVIPPPHPSPLGSFYPHFPIWDHFPPHWDHFPPTPLFGVISPPSPPFGIIFPHIGVILPPPLHLGSFSHHLGHFFTPNHRTPPIWGYLGLFRPRSRLIFLAVVPHLCPKKRFLTPHRSPSQHSRDGWVV